ncbi:hypothetical protein FEM48_Zijuj10G0009500 [Ziziphus jujuba var. spinosa]|uniref:Disease resistance RPP13-like protein 1 n=1 Tax=Ziziphus jujuba var. spinosa TaxID=714518 RepID=A0A978UKC3_ZIZJJ|nr:hypothetical protein FEM48_Zijuj10G0009500 [Ziziphus jujuba var. spinosa]
MLREEHDDSSNLHVIAIVGMGGIGKTTLAQLLYNDDRVEKHFDHKSWVYISERFDISMATKIVLTAVTDDHPASQSSCYDNKDLDWLQNKLKKTLDSVFQTTQLRTLLPSSSNSFDYLSNEAVNQLVSGLKILRVLKELTFSWSDDTKDQEHATDMGVLEELLSGTELKRLNIIGYRGMKFPNCFRNPNTISSIVSIKLERCRHCQSLPALGELPSLKTLYIKQLDGVVRVNEEFYGTNGKFASLESLSFSSMSAWEEWNSTGVGVQDGEVFPRLRELLISDCDSLITVHLPQNLPSLTKLVIPSPLLTSTASAIGFAAEFLPTSLTHVEIKNCQNLESFPLHSLPNLAHLDFVACGSLKEIKDAGKSLSLSSLFIKDCPNFISFNEGRLKAPNLNSLTVEGCERLTKLPGQMPYLLPSLKKLWIINCPQVESFPAGGLPSNLNGLLIDKCSRLTANRTEWSLQTLSAFEYFDIRDESDANIESFPEMGLLPSCLTSLRIGPLASLTELDMMQLQQLPSLQSFDIQSCPRLTTLKVDRALEAPTLPKLRSLSIEDCQDFTSFTEGGLNAPYLNSIRVERCQKLTKLPG